MFSLTDTDVHTLVLSVLGGLVVIGIAFGIRFWNKVDKRLDASDTVLAQHTIGQSEAKKALVEQAKETKADLRAQSAVLATQSLDIALTAARMKDIQNTLERNFGPNNDGARQKLNTISDVLDGVVATQKVQVAHLNSVAATQQDLLQQVANLDGQFLNHLRELPEIETVSVHTTKTVKNLP
jgi:hypothetical protein